VSGNPAGLLADRPGVCDHNDRRDRAGMRLRGVLIHEVFRKVLYLTPSERAKFSSGRIYSHVTSDVETIQQLSWSGLGIISSPLRIIGAACALTGLCLRRPR